MMDGISLVLYDRRCGELVVKCKSGTYRYGGVSPRLYDVLGWYVKKGWIGWIRRLRRLRIG